MENIKKIKQTINKVLQDMNNKDISLMEYLRINNINILDFLMSIGVNETILCGFYSNDIITLVRELLEKEDTTIDYNENMESIGLDEISLYSKTYGTTFSFIAKSVKYISEKKSLKDSKETIECVNKLYRLEGKKLKKLEFSYKTIIDYYLAKEKIISQKYPLDSAYLFAHDEIIDEFNQLIRQNSFEVISTNELEACTFFELINRLYSFNFSFVYLKLLELVSDKTLLSDDFSLRNMNNSITR